MDVHSTIFGGSQIGPGYVKCIPPCKSGQETEGSGWHVQSAVIDHWYLLMELASRRSSEIAVAFSAWRMSSWHKYWS